MIFQITMTSGKFLRCLFYEWQKFLVFENNRYLFKYRACEHENTTVLEGVIVNIDYLPEELKKMNVDKFIISNWMYK